MIDKQDHGLLLSFVASLTLCKHMGDVMDSIAVVLSRIGYEPIDDEHDDYADALKAAFREDGIRTLNGVSFDEDDDE